MNSKEELNLMKHEYLQPSPDRVVDQKIVQLVSDFVLSRISGERILELGVGDQIWTPKLVNKFKDVTTVDASSELLEEMRKKVGNSWTPVYSYFEEYRPIKRFDLVLATYVLEHVNDVLLIMKLAKDQWLKPNGRFALVVPHALSLHRRLSCVMGKDSYPGQLGETDKRMGHTYCFTVYEMEKLLVTAGFNILEKKGMFAKALPNGMLTHCSDEQLRGLFLLGLELPIEYSAAIYFLAEAKS